MPRTIARVCAALALATACAGGSPSDSGSIPVITTATISGGPGGVSVSDGSVSASDSDGSEGGSVGSDSGEPPTTAAPTTGGPGTTNGPGTTGGTTAAFECGNGIGEPGEACDGMDLKGNTCQDYGFDDGVLACDVDCTLFDGGCFHCGDGSKAMAEACDGADLGGKTCASEGFGGGALKCAADCKSVDTSGCTPLASCGNGVKEGGEQCDGAQLGGQTCVGLGYDQGTLLCSQSCTFDAANCMVLDCAGQGEFCVFDENNPQANCCPPGVKGNVLGICDIFICF
jgi:hypothetical protein